MFDEFFRFLIKRVNSFAKFCSRGDTLSQINAKYPTKVSEVCPVHPPYRQMWFQTDSQHFHHLIPYCLTSLGCLYFYPYCNFMLFICCSEAHSKSPWSRVKAQAWSVRIYFCNEKAVTRLLQCQIKFVKLTKIRWTHLY